MNRREFEHQYSTSISSYAREYHHQHPLWQYDDFVDYLINHQEEFEEYIHAVANAQVKDQIERPNFYSSPVVGEEW